MPRTPSTPAREVACPAGHAPANTPCKRVGKASSPWYCAPRRAAAKLLPWPSGPTGAQRHRRAAHSPSGLTGPQRRRLERLGKELNDLRAELGPDVSWYLDGTGNLSLTRGDDERRGSSRASAPAVVLGSIKLSRASGGDW